MWTRADIPPQTGRLAVVTGANAGLGYEIAQGLAAAGAAVVLACRSEQRAEAAAGRLRDSVPGAQVDVRRLDLADLASVAAFADGLAADHDRLDLLVNNAGLMAVDESRTADGFEMQIATNHLGHFALTAHLLPLLARSPGARVATMSSMGHRRGRLRVDDLMFERRGYGRWQPYFDSKQANLLFTLELQRRLRACAILVASHAKRLLSVEGTSKGGGGRNGKGQFKRLRYNANPSAPCDPPHLQTGHLRRSVAWELAGMVARVGTNLRYGRWLEFGTSTIAARPWLRRALAECRAQIVAILSKPM